jgi:hypothetical protein
MTEPRKSSSSSLKSATSKVITDHVDDMEAFNMAMDGNAGPATIMAALRYAKNNGMTIDAIEQYLKSKKREPSQNAFYLAITTGKGLNPLAIQHLTEKDAKRFEKKSTLLEELEAFGDEKA